MSKHRGTFEIDYSGSITTTTVTVAMTINGKPVKLVLPQGTTLFEMYDLLRMNADIQQNESPATVSLKDIYERILAEWNAIGKPGRIDGGSDD